MKKSLMNLMLSVFSLMVFSNLGFAGSCKTETSDAATKPAVEVAKAEKSTDDMLPGCCAAAFAELARPANTTDEACGEPEVVTEVAKAEPVQTETADVKKTKTGDCSAEDMATCDQKLSCCGTVESKDSKASEKQDS